MMAKKTNFSKVFMDLSKFSQLFVDKTMWTNILILLLRTHYLLRG